MTATVQHRAVALERGTLWQEYKILTAGGVPVGSVGYTVEKDCVWLEWFVLEHERGKGYASAAARQVVRHVRVDWPGKPIRATIRAMNLASLAVARNAGLVEVERDRHNVTVEWMFTCQS
jgi:RimJ/RimL family protein N-acetyltransferase